jgi:hypothetical protein
MRQYDFYQYAGIVAPGTVALVGFAVAYPPVADWLRQNDLTIGEFGIVAVLAYVAGHLVQAVGNALEFLWWRAFGGNPTDWVRSGRRHVLSRQHRNQLEGCVHNRVGLQRDQSLSDISSADWDGLTREMYAEVRSAGQSERLDIFNGTYGLLRGVTAALLVVLVFALATTGLAGWQWKLALLVAASLSAIRMHRFSCRYAHELCLHYVRLHRAGPASDTPAT